MPCGRVCCLIVNLLVKTSELELAHVAGGYYLVDPGPSPALAWPHLWPEETRGEPKLLPEAQTGFRFGKRGAPALGLGR